MGANGAEILIQKFLFYWLCFIKAKELYIKINFYIFVYDFFIFVNKMKNNE